MTGTRNRPARLLVTGFGPFPGVARNPSEVAARDVARSPRFRLLGIEATAVALSTTYAALDDELRPALREMAPDALLMLGVAAGARDLRVETRGLNRASVAHPDAAGVRPDKASLGDGPRVRRSRAQPKRQVEILRRHGFRARASINAGAYLCNAAYFTALREPIPVLFIHIPLPGVGLRKRLSQPRQRGWRERLAAALTEIGFDLVRQARGNARSLAKGVSGARFGS